MKICILSMQNVQNMGSLLQSYSLKKIVEEIGHDVSFLNIEKREEDDILLNDFRNVFPGELQSNGLFARIKRIDGYFVNRLLMKEKIKKQNKKYDGFRKRSLVISGSPDKKFVFDWCVIGSDEVFNCCDNSPWGLTTQLFGDVKEARHVITYAASCGATVVEHVPDAARDRINDGLQQLEAISVRDNNTRKFVSVISGRNTEQHLDPVLVGDFTPEIECCSHVHSLPQKYCVVYAYYNRIYDKGEIAAILSFCRLHHLIPIAVGMPQFWIKDFIVTDPFQCLKIFQGAGFVITDTFHGTIFSAKYCPRFATVVRGSNQNKLQDLIDRIQLFNHQVSEITIDELERAYAQVHDKQKFNAFIAGEKERTISYLKENLKENI